MLVRLVSCFCFCVLRKKKKEQNEDKRNLKFDFCFLFDRPQTLNTMLAPIKSANPNASWPALCQAATAAGLTLSVVGTFGLTQEANNQAFTYYVYSAACTEVELDVLTGDVSFDGLKRERTKQE